MKNFSFAELFTTRAVTSLNNAPTVTSRPVEIGGALLKQVVGGLGPNGTWGAQSGVVAQGPNGTW
jgi:hypothetical protein